MFQKNQALTWTQQVFLSSYFKEAATIIKFACSSATAGLEEQFKTVLNSELLGVSEAVAAIQTLLQFIKDSKGRLDEASSPIIVVKGCSGFGG